MGSAAGFGAKTSVLKLSIVSAARCRVIVARENVRRKHPMEISYTAIHKRAY